MCLIIVIHYLLLLVYDGLCCTEIFVAQKFSQKIFFVKIYNWVFCLCAKALIVLHIENASCEIKITKILFRSFSWKFSAMKISNYTIAKADLLL